MKDMGRRDFLKYISSLSILQSKAGALLKTIPVIKNGFDLPDEYRDLFTLCIGGTVPYHYMSLKFVKYQQSYANIAIDFNEMDLKRLNAFLKDPSNPDLSIDSMIKEHKDRYISHKTWEARDRWDEGKPPKSELERCLYRAFERNIEKTKKGFRQDPTGDIEYKSTKEIILESFPEIDKIHYAKQLREQRKRDIEITIKFLKNGIRTKWIEYYEKFHKDKEIKITKEHLHKILDAYKDKRLRYVYELIEADLYAEDIVNNFDSRIDELKEKLNP